MTTDSSASRGESRFVSLLAALVDQGCQSIVNFLLTVFVARRLTSVEFGKFAVAFVVLISIHGLLRVGFVETYLVRCASSTRAAAASARSLERMLIFVGASLAIATGIIGAAFGVQLALVLFLAGSIFAISRLEAVRAVAIATNDRRATLVIGIVWLATMAIGGLVAELADLSFEMVFWLYIGAATLAYLSAKLLLWRSANSEHSQFGWADIRSLGVPLALEHALTLAAIQGVLPIVCLLYTSDAADE